MPPLDETKTLGAPHDPAAAEPAQPYAAFRAHLAMCPACGSDYHEMCGEGYRLLQMALE